MAARETVNVNVKPFVSYRNRTVITNSLRKNDYITFLAIIALPLYEINISRNFKNLSDNLLKVY